MSKTVDKYMKARKELFKRFGCTQDYFIQTMPNVSWNISGNEGIFFLNYWEEYNKITKAVVVLKDGDPMVFRTSTHTMVIALDCVKIAFVLENSKESD